MDRRDTLPWGAFWSWFLPPMFYSRGLGPSTPRSMEVCRLTFRAGRGCCSGPVTGVGYAHTELQLLGREMVCAALLIEDD